ncbi:MAG: DUF1109 domain-containing protein [Hydrogenophilaceae bacterium]|jgi:hypothetical protein|nr:DUF1109 domain-containing protein [Hydrogenophilaceae bacterium]
MKTDDLIAALAQDAEGARSRKRTRLALIAALGLGLIAAVCVVWGLGVMRGRDAMMPVMMKSGFSALLAAASLPLLARLSQPGRPIRSALIVIAGVLAVTAAAFVTAMMGEAPEARMRAMTGGGFPWCLVFIPILAIPAAAGLFWVVRGLAPTRLAAAGAAVGAAAGSLGAIAYSLYCPIDSPAFVTLWYTAGIGVSAALGALVGSRLLRW